MNVATHRADNSVNGVTCSDFRICGQLPMIGFFQPRQLLHTLSGSELQLHNESSSKWSESSKLNLSISSLFHSLAAFAPPPPPAAAAAALLACSVLFREPRADGWSALSLSDLFASLNLFVLLPPTFSLVPFLKLFQGNTKHELVYVL